MEAHPGPRTGARNRRFVNGRLLLTPREQDRHGPLGPARLAAYLAATSAERAMRFDATPDSKRA